VEKVSWEDTQIFFEILNASEKAIGALKVGWEYQLPTEAEWEYACRAGSKTRYSWGDEVLMYDANWNHLQDAQKTEAVGSYYANSWGFYDMHGNVWEWVADWFDAAYPTSLVIDPTGPVSGKYRVLRGGSWNSPGNYLRSAMRFYNTPRATGDNMGFRVALRKTRQSSKSTSLTQ
jgi:sulfatase modifying factor 1